MDPAYSRSNGHFRKPNRYSHFRFLWTLLAGMVLLIYGGLVSVEAEGLIPDTPVQLPIAAVPSPLPESTIIPMPLPQPTESPQLITPILGQTPTADIPLEALNTPISPTIVPDQTENGLLLHKVTEPIFKAAEPLPEASKTIVQNMVPELAQPRETLHKPTVADTVNPKMTEEIPSTIYKTTPEPAAPVIPKQLPFKDMPQTTNEIENSHPFPIKPTAELSIPSKDNRQVMDTMSVKPSYSFQPLPLKPQPYGTLPAADNNPYRALFQAILMSTFSFSGIGNGLLTQKGPTLLLSQVYDRNESLFTSFSMSKRIADADFSLSDQWSHAPPVQPPRVTSSQPKKE